VGPSTTLAGDEDEEDAGPVMRSPAPTMSFEAMDVAGEMGVTVGGAQDINYARDRIAAGEVPHPNVFTPEGLFSEHDLPIAARGPCRDTICADGVAARASLIAQPDVRYLAQLGFSSGLDPDTWRRAPLNLVAVVDTSCSMGGGPIETVRESLIEVADRLGPQDRLSVVRYSDVVETVLPPTSPTNGAAIARGVERLRIAGSTYMEAGLKAGYALARRSAPGFDGTTRVMLFTDERPNVGRTDADSFMTMAEAAARAGVGMTTVGVATHFGAELAQKVSSVRGGNLVFFPDVATMKDTFAEDFDTLVTELAHDLRMEVAPGAGLEIAGIYGIPGEAMEWGDDGSIRLEVATLFLSKRKGAIYVALAPAGDSALPLRKYAPDAQIASVRLSYSPLEGRRVDRAVSMPLVRDSELGDGLLRGRLLVDEITTLKAATALHHEQNDQEGAYQLVHALASIFRSSADPTLAEERAMVFDLERTLAGLSGHAGEPEVAQSPRHKVTGLPRR